ncbi:MAG: preprotein translocase subunit YajC [Actinobacteria bacterium]|nr:MAG: preprotein translocase subunit YajC [Actinomycetota bacterium]
MGSLQSNALPLMLLVLLVLMMVWSARNRKKMLARQEEETKKLAEMLVPGAWVKTSVGFWGRYVDQDGDVVILETADGTETYWDPSVIRLVDDLPFAAESETEEDQETESETEEESVLGLPSAVETDDDRDK